MTISNVQIYCHVRGQKSKLTFGLDTLNVKWPHNLLKFIVDKLSTSKVEEREGVWIGLYY
jgi:hypothetical protein